MIFLRQGKMPAGPAYAPEIQHSGFRFPALRDVLRIVDQSAFFGDAVDRTEEILDDVFKLALAFDHGAHALEFVGFDGALDQSDSMALGNAI
jgi:hypothetical protein